MLPGRKYGPNDIVRLLAARGWLIALPLAMGLAMAPVLAQLVPELYRSETMIMVIPQRVPDQYIRSMVIPSDEDRRPRSSSQILSRSRLERIINDFNLYADERTSQIMEDIVQQMRDDISVELEGQDAFRVSYVSDNPQTAQRVTARLASLYIEENLRDRKNVAEETNLFLESQLNDAKERLIEHEKKLEAYRRQHSGELPSQLDSNLQAIRNAQQQLQSVSESINRSRERRLLIERQIADVETFPVAMTQPAMSPAAPVEPLTTERQIEDVQTKLDTQRLHYTPDHPSIRALERTLRELQAKRDNEGQPPQPEQEKPRSAAELVRQKRLSDLRADLEVIDHQLATSQAEETGLKRIISDYQAKVEVVPTRESELVELTRDYGTLQTAYTNLLTKREESKIAANLEQRQIGEQFRILDPASLPERPSNQMKRLGTIASGAVSGLLLGLLLVGFLEFSDSTLRNEEEVVRVIGLPVLAVVPQMLSTRDRRARFYRTVAANTAACAALLAAGGVIVVWQLRWWPF